MKYNELLQCIHDELEKISCYQISPEEVIEICQKFGAVFPYQRSERFEELTRLSEEASSNLKESLNRLKIHTESIKK